MSQLDQMEFETHVCLVSREAAANFLPAVSEGFKPKYVVLVVTKEMDQQAESLKEAFKRAIPGVQVFNLTLSSSWNIEKTTDEISKFLLDNDLPSPVLNATGGHKLMMLGAYRAFYLHDRPVFYFRVEQGDIQLITPNDKQEKISTIKCEPNLEHYLLAYGYRIDSSAKKSERAFDYIHKELCETLIKNHSTYSDGMKAINYLATEAEKNGSLNVSYSDKNPAVVALLEEFEKYKILKISSDKVNFASESDRQFANGGWLESYVYDAVCQIIQGKKLAKNITILSLDSNVKNEIDVAFVYANRLYLIECKTSSEQSKFSDFIYKIDSLGKIGGTKVRKILISYQEIQDRGTLERAKANKVDIIDGKDLVRLIENLKKCLKKDI